MIVVKWPVYFWLIMAASTVMIAGALATSKDVIWAGLGLMAVVILLVRMTGNDRPFIQSPPWWTVPILVLGICFALKAFARLAGLTGPSYYLLGVTAGITATLVPAWPLLGGAVVDCTLARFGKRRDYYRGVIAKRGGRTEEAYAALTRRLVQNPNDVDALRKRSEVLADMGRTEEAAADLASAVNRMRPGDEKLRLRGEVYFRSGAYDLAARDLSLLELSSDWPGQSMLICSLVAVRKLETAARRLPEANAAGLVAPVFLRAEVSRFRGDWKDAVKHYEETVLRARKVANVSPGARVLAAMSFARLGQRDRARQLALEILAENPGDEGALSTRALLEVLDGDLDAAYATISSLVRPATTMGLLTDPQFAPTYAEERFRRLLVELSRRQAAVREQMLDLMGM